MALNPFKRDEEVYSEPLSDQERLRAAQITQIYNQSSLGGLAASIGAVILAGALWNAEPHLSLILWTLCYLAHFVFHRYLAISFRKIQPAGRSIFKWGRMHQGATLWGGMLWGFAAIFLFPENFLHLQIFMIIFVGGIVAGAVAIYSPTNEYLQNIIVALLPLAGQFFYHADVYNITVGSLLLMYGAIMALSGWNIHKTYAELLTLRFERQDLIEDLEREINWRKQVELDLVRSRDELEVRVEQRTAEIAKVNENLLAEIVERERIESALRLSQEAYRSLSENIPGIVYRFWPSTNQIRFFNSRLEQMTGFTDDNSSLSAHNPLQSLVVEEDKSFVAGVISNAMTDNKPFEINYRIRTVSGETRWCTNYGSAGGENDLKSRYIDGVIFDIADRQIAAELIRESEEKYRLLVENAQEAIFVVQDGFLRFFNLRTSELLGYSPDELSVAPFKNMAHQDDRKEATVIYALEPAGQSHSCVLSFRMVQKNGGILWALVNSVPITWSDRPATLNFLTDITDIKRAEDKNARTERLRVIGELASGVAHNFNNLLQVIMGSAELALTDLKTGDLVKANDSIERLRDSAKFGSETVKRLQSFARIRTNDNDSGMTIFDLSEVVKRSSEMSRSLWSTHPERAGIHIDMDLNLCEGCLISGKDSEVFEVLLNLIKNSVESMPYGGRIAISTGITDDNVIIKVQDNGIGIARSDFDRLFDPFWSTKGLAGTGLGLAVTHSIVKRHGGSVSVESEVGKGTTFSIQIPMAKQILSDAPYPLNEKLHEKHRILLIDDTETILLILNDLLTSHDQTVFTANSGKKGIDIYLNEHIDLIISDLSMPGMTGWEVGSVIRSTCVKKGIPKTPFILLTGWGGQSLEPEKISSCGIDVVLEKPIEFRSLLEMINKLTEQSKSAKASRRETV